MKFLPGASRVHRSKDVALCVHACVRACASDGAAPSSRARLSAWTRSQQARLELYHRLQHWGWPYMAASADTRDAGGRPPASSHQCSSTSILCPAHVWHTRVGRAGRRRRGSERLCLRAQHGALLPPNVGCELCSLHSAASPAPWL